MPLGRNHYVRLDNASGSLTTIHEALDKLTYTHEAEEIEGPSIGVVGRSKAAGLEDWGFDCEGVLDQTYDEIFYDAIAEQKSFEDSPGGTDTGSVKNTGECIGVSYEIETDYEKETRFSFSAQAKGVLTEDFYS